jgi:hypothetical protein
MMAGPAAGVSMEASVAGMMFRRLQIAAFRRSLPHSAVKMKLLQKLAPVACRSFKI